MTPQALSIYARIEAVKATIASMQARNLQSTYYNEPPFYTEAEFCHYADELQALALLAMNLP